jgi:hypothetical protein
MIYSKPVEIVGGWKPSKRLTINRGSEWFSGAPVNKNLPLFLCLLIKN